MACPSEVDVPRPSSSNATSEFLVADDCNKSLFSEDAYALIKFICMHQYLHMGNL